MFLKQCKVFNIVPKHLAKYSKNAFNLYHYRSAKKLDSVLLKLRQEILDIEIFDLHRIINVHKKNICKYTQRLSNNVPSYILKEIFQHHNICFKRYHHKLYHIHKKK